MCGLEKRIKNIIVNGNITAGAPTISQVISLPFQPTSVEVTRLCYYCVVQAGQDSIMQITTSMLTNPIATMVAYSTGAFNQEQHDRYLITQPIQGEYTFTVGSIFGALPSSSAVKFSLNLAFHE